MQRVLLLAAGIPVLTGCPGPPQSAERVKEEMRRLIPEAASSPKEDWLMVSDKEASKWKKKLENFDSFPLSRAVILYIFNRVAPDEMKPDFVIARKPNADQAIAETLAAARKSLDRGYGTLIPSESITNVTCELKGGRATGVVSFRVEGAYQGKVEYTAEQAEGRWQIVAFRLPGYQLEVTRTGDGKWACPKLDKRK